MVRPSCWNSTRTEDILTSKSTQCRGNGSFQRNTIFIYQTYVLSRMYDLLEYFLCTLDIWNNYTMCFEFKHIYFTITEKHFLVTYSNLSCFYFFETTSVLGSKEWANGFDISKVDTSVSRNQKRELMVHYKMDHNHLTLYHSILHFDPLKIYSCRKHCEKRRNCLLQAISPFLTMFSTPCGSYFPF